MTIKRHNICQLSGKPVIDHNFASTGLIQHRHLHTVSEGTHPVCKDDIHIFNEGTAAYSIIGNIILYIFNAAVISDSHIMQSGIINSGMLAHSSR